MILESTSPLSFDCGAEAEASACFRLSGCFGLSIYLEGGESELTGGRGAEKTKHSSSDWKHRAGGMGDINRTERRLEYGDDRLYAGETEKRDS